MALKTLAVNRNNVKVEKLERAEHSGDWHDKPLKWKVVGPDKELQKFPTKAEAKLYAGIRRRSASYNGASNEYQTVA